MGFDFAQMLPMAGALALTAMSGGAAAPALAAAEGATAAGAAGAAGAAEAAAAMDAAAAGMGSVAEADAAASALGATQAAPGVGAAVAPSTGAVAPTGQASILGPMGQTPQPALGSGISGAANPFAPQGSMMGGQPQLPMGMTSQPLTSSAPMAGPAPGSGLSGSGAFQTMPTSPVAPAGLSMPSAQQIQEMKTVAGQLQGNNQQAPAAPGGGVGPRGNSNIQMANMSTPAVGARPSLAQLLYGRR